MQRSFLWKACFAQASVQYVAFYRQISASNLGAAGNKQQLRGKTVLVAGATGGVGSQVVQCLRNEGVKVRALVRDYTKAVGAKTPDSTPWLHMLSAGLRP